MESSRAGAFAMAIDFDAAFGLMTLDCDSYLEALFTTIGEPMAALIAATCGGA